MNHLDHEDLILAYYDDPAAAEARAHVASCDACRTELAAFAAVLDRVTPAPTPELAADYESQVWQRLQWRLRGERKKRSKLVTWMQWSAVAAVAGIAFCTGLVWKPKTEKHDTLAAKPAVGSPAQPAHATTPAAPPATRDRILMVVVSDHFDESERVLVELTNLKPADGTDLSSERARAGALLASNRLYRHTASDRGEENVATLLSELEPVLLQLAHAPDDVSADEIRSIQKRIESRGLVFKLRVVRAGVRDDMRDRQSSTPKSDI